MSCPFLREARVKFCDKSAFRKMIRISGPAAEESCSTPRYRECAVYRRYAQNPNAGPYPEQCPYLRESLAQYCAASAVSQLIPYSEPPLSRCSSDSSRYCDVYMDAADAPSQAAGRRDASVGGIHVPTWLDYSPNHMWLDAAHGGSCHLGLDAFLTRALGAVESVTFLRQTGVHRPSAVLTVHGIDLEVIFPKSILLTASNLYLRANPARLTADPYGMGWLFQGIQLSGQPPVTDGLIHGDDVEPWIEREIGRMSAFLSACWNGRHGAALMHDGGVFAPDVLQHLNHEETLRLFREFFVTGTDLPVSACDI